MEKFDLLIHSPLAVFGATVALALGHNLLRGRLHWQGPLTPNCLLTRYPILLIPGPKSFWYFKNYYNLLPSYLAEHGYEVFHGQLPWKKGRKKALKGFLQQAQMQGLKLHIIAHPRVLQELALPLSEHSQVIASKTAYSHIEETNFLSPLRWINRLHQLLTPMSPPIYELGPFSKDSTQSLEALMNQLQQLAENDYIEGQQHERCHQ